jgi:hypothetical protein
MPMRLRPTKTMGRSCVRRRAYLTFAAFAVLVAYQPAEGQESSQFPTLEPTDTECLHCPEMFALLRP